MLNKPQRVDYQTTKSGISLLTHGLGYKGEIGILSVIFYIHYIIIYDRSDI